MSRYLQGFFRPKNPKKYKGDPTQIVYRSSWEFSLMRKLDSSPDIARWNSESIIIPYTSPVDGRYHRYFPDLWFEKVSGEQFLIEIKPKQQCESPKRKNQSEKTFLREVATYSVNQAKWESAERYCKKRGWTFQVLTEKDLNCF